MLQLSIIDKIIIHFDSLLHSKPISNNNPANNIANTEDLDPSERRASIAMMRINHSGEICAQALYQGQALTARTIEQYNSLMQAAAEENDHLQWCRTRLYELNGRPSLLNPLWYVGSFGIGAIAGLAGDKISMGFLAETEYQVTKHIDAHLRKMSYKDQKSRTVLEQMRIDELKHAHTAEQQGAVELPIVIKWLMKATSKVLTVTANKI